MIKYFVWVLIVCWGILYLSSCNDDYIPKPRGYLRIELPEKSYHKFDTNFPYSFEYPSYTRITRNFNAPGEKYWINITYPQFKGVLHLSYKRVIDDNLFEYMEDAYVMVNKHIPKASSIEDVVIYEPEKEHYGLVYKIKGVGTASPYQFFITDSSDHFLRGALYFNFKPNNDSMAPVIDFIEQDIDHLVSTLKWN